MIVGGESGAKKNAAEFPIEWALEIHRACEAQGVPYFCKQLGRNPTINGELRKLKAHHGDNWDEWSEVLKVREFPDQFRAYREAKLAEIG